MRKNIKQKLGYILTTCIILVTFSSTSIFAAETNIPTPSTSSNSLIAKTAYLTNIDEYGSNWENATITNGAAIINDTILHQTSDTTTLHISTTILGDSITITGTPVGKSENGNVIYFEATNNSSS